MTKTVAVSGGFDPLHTGHLDLMIQARALGDQLIVILNSDAWLRRKKGYALMPWVDRARLIDAYPFVAAVVPAEDDDGTVCKTLEHARLDIFANGGDRDRTNTPEIETCRRLGIEMRWNVGGAKTASSSDLVQSACLQIATGLVEAAGGQVIVTRNVLEDVNELTLHREPCLGGSGIKYWTE